MKTHMRLFGAFISVALLGATTVVLCGGSASAKPISSAIAAISDASSCGAPTIKLGMIGPVKAQEQDITPQIQGAEAAAAAVTRTCELGGPVKLISCNDQYNPNVAAQCARELVSDGVIALVGDQSPNGDTYTPIMSAAGIPEVGSLASSGMQLTNPLSYPLLNGIVGIISEASVAKNLGATKVEIAGIDLAEVQQLIALVSGTVKQLGLQYAGAVLVPPTATDMSTYAAQAVATGADAILPVFPSGENDAFVKALAQQGTNFGKVRVILNGATTSPQDIAQIGKGANGAYLIGEAWPSWDTSNPGIKQYDAELKAAGFHSVDKNDMSVISWSDVHIIANLLKGSRTKTASTLVAKIKASGPMSPPQLAPFNWSKNAFPSNPILSKMQSFSTDGVILRVEKGVERPVTNGYVDLFNKFTVKKG
jgi:ABC-type branched-subunit amino acid transport system substrate-binding protein